jgi:hypothetical protein
MTVTSADPTHFLLSTSTTALGTASVTVPITQGSGSVPAIYIQGQNYSGTTAINATITASATGYTNATATASLYPSGLYLGTGSFTTTTFSTPTNLTVYLATLSPGSLTLYSYYPIGPQASPITFSIASGTTATGTITGSPASIPVQGYYNNTSVQFQPLTAGSSVLTLTEPAGYSTPSNEPLQATATVTAPAINVGSAIVGNNTYTGLSLSLGAAPPSNETMTITSSDPTHFLLSTSTTAVGSASVTVTLTAGNGSIPTVYIQGQNYSGATAITAIVTASAAGYTNGMATTSLYPSGLYLGTGSFSTTTSSSPTNLTVYFATLSPGTLTLYSYFPLGPQASPISFSIASGTTAAGTITGSPASITVQGYYNNTSVQFQPLAAGSSVLTLTEPAGYSTPSNESLQITATVTP